VPIDANLFEDYASAVMELFDATDRLADLVGQHGQFEKQKEDAAQTHEKCSAARLALEQHWAQHCCRETGESWGRKKNPSKDQS
jgi:hypothetical protein